MKFLVIFCSFLLFGACTKITAEENDFVQKTCGLNVTKQDPITERKNYTFFVAVYFRTHFMHRGEPTPYTYTMPGVIISPKHIAIQKYCESNHRQLLKFDFDFILIDKKFDAARKFVDPFSKITILFGCSNANHVKMMILTLKKPLQLNKDVGLACLSNSTKNWLGIYDQLVFGADVSGFMTYKDYFPVACAGDTPLVCGRAAFFEDGICNKDTGGCSFAEVNKRMTLLGIFVSGTIDCAFSSAGITRSVFLNVARYTEEICNATGVCINLDSTKLVTTTSGSKE
uniref:Peptidase S1 domain-containing protein n=1 Tax=Caenorhabditis tropicalis TaxID=1561998 RepID=A0A1I7TRM2_9PELO